MSESSTVISKKAVGKVVTEALRSVPGCIKHSSGLDRFTGRELPRFDIDLDEDNTACAVEVQIAVRWPAPVTAVAVTVREVVAGWIESSTKIPVVSVAVTVVDVVPAGPEYPIERITAQQLDNTPRFPDFRPIIANPIVGEEIVVKRAHPKPHAPSALTDVELTPFDVHHAELVDVDPGTLADVWSPKVADSADVIHVSSDVPERELLPITTDHTEVPEQLTPTPLTPTIAPQRPSSAGRVKRISTDVPAPVLKPVQVKSRAVVEQYTPTPITPSFTPQANRTPVTHLADNIDSQRRLTPVTVQRRDVVRPSAQPLKARKPAAQPLRTRKPSAQPLRVNAVDAPQRRVTREITVDRTELKPITVDHDRSVNSVTVDRQPVKSVKKEGDK